ncbi:MAG: hypothetical protein WD851_00365 [Pirellulales bacterium]
MRKGRPDFAEDLSGIQEDVVNDVGKILELANSTRRESGGAGTLAPSTAPEITIRRPRVRPDHAKKTVPGQAPVVAPRATLVNVTTRLSHQTNELLTEAALRQRLKKISPASRQDIMETAIQEWFERNGYSI